MFPSCWVCLYQINESSYRLHHLHNVLVKEFEDDLSFVLVSVVLIFVWSPSVVEPVSVLVVLVPFSILIIVIPVCIVLVSLFISWLLLIISVPAVVSAVVLSVVAVVVTRVIVASVI